MATYVILSRLLPDAVPNSEEFKTRAKTVAYRLQHECPGVTLKESYALLGRFDLMDIIEGDDPDEITKAATIIRSSAHAITETMPATPWDQFLGKL